MYLVASGSSTAQRAELSMYACIQTCSTHKTCRQIIELTAHTHIHAAHYIVQRKISHVLDEKRGCSDRTGPRVSALVKFYHVRKHFDQQMRCGHEEYVVHFFLLLLSRRNREFFHLFLSSGNDVVSCVKT